MSVKKQSTVKKTANLVLKINFLIEIKAENVIFKNNAENIILENLVQKIFFYY